MPTPARPSAGTAVRAGRSSRPTWPTSTAAEFRGADLLAGGVPCPPFSVAGRQLGAADERDLFPEALRLARQIGPRAVLLENVRGLAAGRFDGYRAQVVAMLRELGYQTWWQLVQASEHGVPQLRPRLVLVAIRQPWAANFRWPEPSAVRPPTVGESLADLMAAGGWPGALSWATRAAAIAPTIVGGSRKHGGPDLGPTRARAAWRQLGVDGLGIADAAPGALFPAGAAPRLTTRMVARLQGFPDGGSSPAARPVPTARSGTRSRRRSPARCGGRGGAGLISPPGPAAEGNKQPSVPG